MNISKNNRTSESPYCAFKNDTERKWALVSRDVRWVLVAALLVLADVPATKWSSLWRIIAGS